MRNLIGLTLAAAVVAAGCGPSDSSGGDAQRVQVAKMIDAVPSATSAQRMGDVVWYVPDSLYEYIDGDAVRFTDAGFARLAHSEWRSASAQGDAYVELDIYDQGSPQGALDIMADGRTPDTAYLDIGSEAHQIDDGMELRVGQYYVKLIARRDIGGQRDLVKAIAGAVAKAPPPGPSDDELLAPLPTANRVAHSGAYVTKGFLGRDFLQRIREATYEAGDKRVRLFLMDAQDPEKAKALWGEWKESIPPQPPAGHSFLNSFSYTEPYVGPVMVAHRGHYVAGAIGEPAAARPMLDALLKRLD